MKKLLSIFIVLILAGCKSDKKNDQENSATEKTALHNPEVQESFSRGAKIYNNFCATCHLSNGEGIENAFPPIAGSDWLTDKRTETIRAVKHGLKGPIEVNGIEYNSLMPAMGLSDQEVTDVLNYIFYAWDNNVEDPATLEEVKSVKE
ncbi:hypothetical protein GCM10007103_26930 [Salinimicrobium marinum]|uniref:Cytochrome c domain-containing protein n=1 Tax=Salinimicrobium marinum TaxID=680283 RepID=A0A918SHM0_9FLAO|nr:cytochrome c [Salinimicrobium marinum]GHA44313.1 hypothetical protein GCM10007103_26930 [Salinimicrobium marinum]